MRRVIGHLRRNERGGISVMVALLMVVLLGAAAVAIDTGLIYAERAELQNGADAAALAIAEECANDELVCIGIPAPKTCGRCRADEFVIGAFFRNGERGSVCPILKLGAFGVDQSGVDGDCRSSEKHDHEQGHHY